MESKVMVLIILLLLIVLTATLPATARRSCLLRNRINWKVHSQLLLDEGQFRRMYKMSYASFMALAAKLEPYLPVDKQQSRNRTGTEPITHINKIQMCLRWLSGGSFHDIRINSGVSVGAFYTSIHQVVDAIISHPDLQINFPTTLTEQRHAAKAFTRLSNSGLFKGCIGAIDGWLCPIQVPSRAEVARVRSFFSGHYQRYGVNVQACCDHHSRFTAVTCSSPGGSGDAVAYLKWQLSNVVENLPSGLYVVGDNAYTNTNHLLTPFPRPRISSAAHDSYNFHLSQLRIRIEMAFGLLVCKWRVFKAPLEIGFKRVPSTILAACILHNWCINQRLRENNRYCVEDDEDLIDGIDEVGREQVVIQDATIESHDASTYRRLYQSSDLAIDGDTTSCSEWARNALVGLIEHEAILRPTRNIARRAQQNRETL